MSGIDDIFGGEFGAAHRPADNILGFQEPMPDDFGSDDAGVDVSGLAGPETAARSFKGLRMLRRSPLLDETLRYWTSLREGAELPLRSALDPKEMRFILGHAMILDRVRHGTVRIRLGGTAMERLMGLSVRGLPIRALFDLADRTRAVDLFEQVFDKPASLELDLISDAPGGLVTGRMLVLPLRDAAGRISKALTVMVTDRAVEDPRRFSVTNATLLPLSHPDAAQDARRRRTNDLPLPQSSRSVAGAMEMAEPPAEFHGRPSGVPWLRVVK